MPCKQQVLQWLLVGTAFLLTGCSPVRPLPTQQPTASAATDIPATPTVDRWQEIRQWPPYPYTTPLPPQVATPIDGIYVRFDPRGDPRPPCRRCPPYPPEGGVWKLELDRGVFFASFTRARAGARWDPTQSTATALPSSTTRNATWRWATSRGGATTKGCTLP